MSGSSLKGLETGAAHPLAVNEAHGPDDKELLELPDRTSSPQTAARLLGLGVLVSSAK